MTFFRPDQSDLTPLRQKLVEYFNEEEVRTLCFDLNLDYDDLPASGKANKVRELVDLLRRQHRLPALVSLCARERPHVNWSEFMFDAPPPESDPDLFSAAKQPLWQRLTTLKREIWYGAAGVLMILLIGVVPWLGGWQRDGAVPTPTATSTPLTETVVLLETVTPTPSPRPSPTPVPSPSESPTPAESATPDAAATAAILALTCAVPAELATIQEALDQPQCEIIALAAGTFSANLVISRSVTIRGQGTTLTILDGGKKGRVLEITAGQTVLIEGLTVANGLARGETGLDGGQTAAETTGTPGVGGGILNSGSLTLTDLLLRDNQAHGGGGGSGPAGAPGLIVRHGTKGSSAQCQAVPAGCTESGGTGGSGFPGERGQPGQPGGQGGDGRGGGIFNEGRLVLNNVRLLRNEAAGGAGGSGGTGGSGGPGGNGGEGGDRDYWGCYVGRGGSGGSGGNGGPGGSGGAGGAGGAGLGGAIFNSGSLEILAGALSTNLGRSGQAGESGNGGAGGAGGRGGGAIGTYSSLSGCLFGVTQYGTAGVNGRDGSSGAVGEDGAEGAPGTALGGALYLDQNPEGEPMWLTDTEIANNSALIGAGIFNNGRLVITGRSIIGVNRAPAVVEGAEEVPGRDYGGGLFSSPTGSVDFSSESRLVDE